MEGEPIPEVELTPEDVDTSRRWEENQIGALPQKVVGDNRRRPGPSLADLERQRAEAAAATPTTASELLEKEGSAIRYEDAGSGRIGSPRGPSVATFHAAEAEARAARQAQAETERLDRIECARKRGPGRF